MTDAIILHQDGGREETQPRNGKTFTLAELQRIVQCPYVGIVNIDDGTLVYNEEGKLLNLPRNEDATKLVTGYFHPDDYIAGTALHCRKDQIR